MVAWVDVFFFERKGCGGMVLVRAMAQIIPCRVTLFNKKKKNSLADPTTLCRRQKMMWSLLLTLSQTLEPGAMLSCCKWPLDDYYSQ